MTKVNVDSAFLCYYGHTGTFDNDVIGYEKIIVIQMSVAYVGKHCNEYILT